MNAYMNMLTEWELMEHVQRIEHRIEELRRLKSEYENALKHKRLEPVDEFDAHG